MELALAPDPMMLVVHRLLELLSHLKLAYTYLLSLPSLTAVFRQTTEKRPPLHIRFFTDMSTSLMLLRIVWIPDSEQMCRLTSSRP